MNPPATPRSVPAVRTATEGVARPRWIWMPVVLVGSGLLLAFGAAILLEGAKGGMPPRVPIDDLIPAVFSLVLGLSGLIHLPETVAVYRWDAVGLTKSTVFRRKSIRWDDLADATSSASLLNLQRYDLASRSGTNLSIRLYLLPEALRLHALLQVRLGAVRRHKVEEALRRPETRFEFRILGLPVTRVVFDGVRLRRDSRTITLASVTLIRKTPIYVHGIQTSARIELIAPNNKTFWFASTLRDIDLLYDLIRERAPQAGWVGFEDKAPAPLTVPQRREELAQRVKSTSFHIWHLWALTLMVPVIFFAVFGLEIFRWIAEAKTWQERLALMALVAIIAAYTILMLLRVRNSYRVRARFRRERAGGSPPLTR